QESAAPMVLEGTGETVLQPINPGSAGKGAAETESPGTGEVLLQPQQPTLQSPQTTPVLEVVKGPAFLAVTRNTPYTTEFSQGGLKGQCDNAKHGFNGCGGQASIGSDPMTVCRQLKRLLGTLEKFKFANKSFTKKQLEQCNGESAAGPKVKGATLGGAAINTIEQPQTTVTLAKKRSGGSLLSKTLPAGGMTPLLKPQPQLGAAVAPQVRLPGSGLALKNKTGTGGARNVLQKQKKVQVSVMEPLKLKPKPPVQKQTFGSKASGFGSALHEKSGQATFGSANKPINAGSSAGFKVLCNSKTDPWGCALPKIVNMPKVIGPKKGDRKIEINLGLSNFSYAQIEAIDTKSGKSRGVIWKKTLKTSQYIENISPRPVDNPTVDTTYRLKVTNARNTNKPLVKDFGVKVVRGKGIFQGMSAQKEQLNVNNKLRGEGSGTFGPGNKKSIDSAALDTTLADKTVKFGPVTNTIGVLCDRKTDPWACLLPKIVNEPKVIGPKKGDSKIEINLGLSHFKYAQIEAIDAQSGKSRGVIWKMTSTPGKYIENISPRPLDRPTADTTYRLRVSNPHNTNKPLVKDLRVKVARGKGLFQGGVLAKKEQIYFEDRQIGLEVQAPSDLIMGQILRTSITVSGVASVKAELWPRKGGKVIPLLDKKGMSSSRHTLNIKKLIGKPGSYDMVVRALPPGPNAEKWMKEKRARVQVKKIVLKKVAIYDDNGQVIQGGKVKVYAEKIENAGYYSVDYEYNKGKWLTLAGGQLRKSKKYSGFSVDVPLDKVDVGEFRLRMRACIFSEGQGMGKETCVENDYKPRLVATQKVEFVLPLSVQVRNVPGNRLPVWMSYECKIKGIDITRMPKNVSSTSYTTHMSYWYTFTAQTNGKRSYKPVLAGKLVEGSYSVDCELYRIGFAKFSSSTVASQTGRNIFGGKRTMYATPAKNWGQYSTSGSASSSPPKGGVLKIGPSQPVNITIDGYWKCQLICTSPAPGEPGNDRR
ncbi:MAG: hypothetical protein GXP09_08745, partial [Gammaproteobacteria bacterium]|nr:hypothetical protein [Gammaproteobacteria bacterium]